MSSESGKLLTITWKIVNYSLCQLKNMENLKSSVISAENFNDTKWYLTLYPNGGDKESSGFVSCFLYRNEKLNESKNGFSTSCTLEILDPFGKILATLENKFLNNFGTGSYKFLEVQQLTRSMENWKNDVLEVRCQLFDSNYNGTPILCETHTQIQIKKYLFDWKILIPEFQDWSKKLKCQFEERTPIDITLTAPDSKIYLKIQTSTEQTLTELWKMKISILNKEGVNIGLENSTYILKSSEFETSFRKNQIEDKSGFTLIYSFKLICAIYVSDGTSTSTFVNYENTLNKGFQQLAIPRLSLQNDLKDMFLNKKHSDVKLRADNEIVPVHKCLLSARSPVFSAMFDRDMLESQTGIVDIPDVESEVLRSFVEFLYTDVFRKTDHTHVLKLMLLADKYQVIVLKEGCSQILMSLLSMENVCEIISAAEMVNQVNLKELALHFIKINKKMILLSPDWSGWVEENTKLAIEILTKLSME